MTRARDLANLVGSGNFSSTTFTATEGQTAFTISHTQGFVQVFMNGLLLDETADYTSNGTAITLTSGASAGDEIEVVAYNTFSVGDGQTQTAADARYVKKAGDTMTGNLGIGAAPTRALHVDHATDATMIVNAAAGNQATYLLGEGGASKFNMSHKASDDTFQIYNYYNSGISLKIDSLGRVTKPSQVSFKAHGGSSAYITTSPLQFPNIGGRGGHNIGNHYNTSNSTFTAPVGGRYLFHVHVGIVRMTSTGGYIYPNLEINSGSIMYTYNNQSFNNSGSWNQYANSHMTQIVNLAANDVVRVTVSFGSADYYGGPGELSFAGHLLG